MNIFIIDKSLHTFVINVLLILLRINIYRKSMILRVASLPISDESYARVSLILKTLENMNILRSVCNRCCVRLFDTVRILKENI